MRKSKLTSREGVRDDKKKRKKERQEIFPATLRND